MTDRPPWVVRAENLDALRGERLTAWDRALDDGDADVNHGPNTDCFSCEHIRASSACALMARAETRRDILRIIDCFEYRAASDPHVLCPHHLLAPAPELARRCGQTMKQWEAESRAMQEAASPSPSPLPSPKAKPMRVRKRGEPDPDDPPPERPPPRAATG